ncbi:hypothetical protein [Maritalea porphyrae]|uniref:hypothetical protein n=1 Tax=Maritalea porphyrae TaxID=880732 RepID=UPI0022AFFEDC|nr:hypothetical protein [Maritalea porphyrae]MCZ4273994.1 hypothetical protein [Maritalea porphyrae]
MTSYLARLIGRHNRLSEDMARIMRPGRVDQYDPETHRVRLDYAPDGRKKFLSPWMQLPEAAGNNSSKVTPVVGQTMMSFAPNGDMRQGFAMGGFFSDEFPVPDAGDGLILLQRGDARVLIVDGGIQITVGGVGLFVSAGEVKTTTKTILNNGTRPAHFKGGKDTAEDKAVDGAEGVLI